MVPIVKEKAKDKKDPSPSHKTSNSIKTERVVQRKREAEKIGMSHKYVTARGSKVNQIHDYAQDKLEKNHQ